MLFTSVNTVLAVLSGPVVVYGLERFASRYRSQLLNLRTKLHLVNYVLVGTSELAVYLYLLKIYRTTVILQKKYCKFTQYILLRLFTKWDLSNGSMYLLYYNTYCFFCIVSLKKSKLGTKQIIDKEKNKNSIRLFIIFFYLLSPPIKVSHKTYNRKDK